MAEEALMSAALARSQSFHTFNTPQITASKCGNNQLECRVCEDGFSLGGDKVPRLLFCGHTLCHACLLRLPTHDNNIHCPFDRQPTPISASGVWGLKKNFALLELLERLSLSRSNTALLPEVLIKQRELGISCDEDEDHLAVLYCTVCASHLCLECSERTHATRTLHKHKRIPLSEKTAEQQQQLQRRQRRDVFDEYNDDELVRRFVMNRAGITAVADLVREKLQSQTEQNESLSPETKVAITLRYLATGEMQQCSCDNFGTSQATISAVISQTIDALSDPDVVTQFVEFPLTRQEVQMKQAEFLEDYGFPGVVGTIDGTHIRIVAPSVDEHLYINRKRYHSINVQVVFDAKYRILNVLARWPGSVYDARILDQSGLKALFEQNYVPAGCYLLGDRGYPCKEWLLTPYLNPQAGTQTNYNRAHKRTCCVVERGIGQLKQRFHVLHGEVQLSPEKTCKMVYVCALLHNMCKQFDIPLPVNEEDGLFDNAAEGDVGVNEEEPGEAEMPPNPGRPPGRNRHPFRDYIASLHFSRPVAE